MDKNTELDFFEQALKAFDAPQLLEELPESVMPEQPAAEPESVAEPEKKPRRKWPAVLGILAVALALISVLLLDFGSEELTVTLRDVESGLFYGTAGTDVYLVAWPGTEDVGIGSRVKVSYFCSRTPKEPDPNIGGYLHSKVWAWNVKSLPNEPSVNIPPNIGPTKAPEYTLTVSIFRVPETALAFSGPPEVTIEFSLSQEDAEALLPSIDALGLPEGMTGVVPAQSDPTASTEPEATWDITYRDDFINFPIKASFEPLGKFVLRADESLYKDAYFSADGRFMTQGVVEKDAELLYAILAHLADATAETAPPYALYVNREDDWHQIGFDADGANMYYISDYISDPLSSIMVSPYGFVQLSHAMVEDILLMWPQDGTRDLYGFFVTGDSLTFSARHSHTTGARIEDGAAYYAVLDTDIEQPVRKDTILFALPQYDVQTDPYELDPDTAGKLQKLLDGSEWEAVATDVDTKHISRIEILLNGEGRTVGLGADGYLYRGAAKAPTSPDTWELLMELMYAAGEAVSAGRYCYASVPEQAVYELNLLADGTYRLERGEEILSFGRYAAMGKFIFLHDGIKGAYLARSGKILWVESSAIEALAALENDSVFDYNGDIIVLEDSVLAGMLPTDGSKSVRVRAQLPQLNVETQWLEVRGSQIENINTLLQNQKWEPVPAMAYLPQDFLRLQIAVENDYEVVRFVTVNLSPDGYLHYNTILAKLSDSDWSAFMALVRLADGSPNLYINYQMRDKEQNGHYDLNLGGSEYALRNYGYRVDSGKFVVIGDVLCLDSESNGICCLQQTEDGGWECLYSVDFSLPLRKGMIFEQYQ